MFLGVRARVGGCFTISVLLTVVGCLKEPTVDGACPRFEYEYKVLEKLVKLELAANTMHTKMADVETTCCATPTRKPPPGSPPNVVAVKARLSGPKAIKDGDRVVYDTLVTDVGGVYDTKTGVFTAPVGGIYSFVVCVCVDQAQWIVMAVFRNANKIGQMLAGDDRYHACATDYTTVRLDAFDKVWVEKIRGAANTLNEQNGWNSFSANLLHLDDV